MVVEQGQRSIGSALGIVLPSELCAVAHLEVRGLAAQDPVEVGALPVELVHRMGVACRDEEGLAVVVLGHGIEVDVVEGLVLRALTVLELRLGLVDGDRIEGAPFEQRIAGVDIDLLDDALPGPAVLGSAD